MAVFTGVRGLSWTAVLLDEEQEIVGTNFDVATVPDDETDVRLGGAGAGSLAQIVETTLAGESLNIRNLDILTGAALEGYSSNLTIHGDVSNAGSWSLLTDYMTVLGRSIDNAGTIRILSDDAQNNNSSALRLGDGTTTLTGAGRLVLGSRLEGGTSNSLSTQLTGMDGDDGLAVLENFSTIEGAGTIGYNKNLGDPGGNLVLHNATGGLIDANIAGVRLHLYSADVTGANPTTNAGIMRASGGGTLYLQVPLLEQTAGAELRADGAGSVLRLHDGRIAGGHLATTGGGRIETANFHTTLDGGSVAGALTIDAGGQVRATQMLELAGEIVNRGTIQVDGYSGQLAATDLTLRGGGAVELAFDVASGTQYRNALVQGTDSAKTGLLVNEDNLIHGAGQIGRQQAAIGMGQSVAIRLSLENGTNGIIAADVAGAPLTLQGLETFSNAGLLRAETGATLRIAAGSGDVATDYADEAQVLDNRGGRILATGTAARAELQGNGQTMTVEGGTLEGRAGGEIHLMNANAVLDGSTARGAVTLLGDIRVQGGGTLTGQIDNKGDLHFDTARTQRLLIEDTARLAGKGEVRLAETGTPGGEIRGATQGGEATLENINNWLHGAGTIGSLWAGSGATGYFRYGLSLTNADAGRISADLKGQTLRLEGLTAFRNDGLAEALKGGLLQLAVGVNDAGRDMAAVIANQGGTLRAAGAGARVELAGGTASLTVQGGTLATVNGGEILGYSGAGLDGSAGALKLLGLFRVMGTTTLRGEIGSSGQIRFDEAGSTRLAIHAKGAALTGKGLIVMDGLTGQDSLTGSGASAALLTNGNTITGGGFIGSLEGAAELKLANVAGGTIRATTGQTLTLDTGRTLRNEGVIEARGGTLDLHDDLTGAGRLGVSAGGTLLLNGTANDRVTITGNGSETVRARDDWATGISFRIDGFGTGDRLELGSAHTFGTDGRIEDFTFSAKGLFRYDTGAGLRSFTLSGLSKTELAVEVSGGMATLVGMKVTRGDSSANVMAGSKGDDRLMGLGGSDTFRSSAGNDIFDGGAGADLVTYGRVKAGVTVTLGAGTADGQASGKGIGTDILRGIEHVTGGSGTDRITGNAAANRLEGGGRGDHLSGLAGADTLTGGAGNDRLTGGTGKDVLTGGSGADVFVFDTALKPGNVDRITDFDTGADSIALAGSAFRSLHGQLQENAFKIIGVPGAKVDADDRLIYNSGTGGLFFDTNGSGAGGRKLIAMIGAGLDLTAGHFDLLG